jgi:hypothetical protein
MSEVADIFLVVFVSFAGALAVSEWAADHLVGPRRPRE